MGRVPKTLAITTGRERINLPKLYHCVTFTLVATC